MIKCIIILFSVIYSGDFFKAQIVDSMGLPIENVNLEIVDENRGEISDTNGFIFIDYLDRKSVV